VSRHLGARKSGMSNSSLSVEIVKIYADHLASYRPFSETANLTAMCTVTGAEG
jgi:hypothetical protein